MEIRQVDLLNKRSYWLGCNLGTGKKKACVNRIIHKQNGWVDIFVLFEKKLYLHSTHNLETIGAIFYKEP